MVQNQALGAILISTFTTEYFVVKGEKNGPTLPHLMLVLPLVFNQHFVKSTYTRRKKGGLFIAINQDRSLIAGIQERMESMGELTMKSINISFASHMIKMDKYTFEFHPVSRKLPDFKQYESIKNMITVTKRLGYWFATIDFPQLCVLLKVRF